ncbi:hypothetical protein O7626_14110 [Micromonospora sp. WMMD1102]|uniref:hypothetical protein n=1 Tax=Micromonospora sp. WMMD1102 TaxID=3016105 RepID=UPI002414D05A|nr:hypothetical protein [Micromonospora sp. WMMD1102]MDG4787050.1 hypothetical protein [Micromonospora sp. WMMD1102]
MSQDPDYLWNPGRWCASMIYSRAFDRYEQDRGGMSYAALIRPVIDRVYVGVRSTGRERIQAVYDQYQVRPGFESSFYFGLLARPMAADSFAAATTYSGSDMTDELEQGIAEVDANGAWRLTERGRDVALAVQRAYGDWAAEFWDRKLIDTMPGLAVVPRLADLVGRLLKAGRATGGPAFRAMAPVHEPANASAPLRLTSRLGALRHHRGDAHRAAWTAAGLTLAQLQAMPPNDPRRQTIEDETNRRDEPIYEALSPREKDELLAGLGALPG